MSLLKIFKILRHIRITSITSSCQMGFYIVAANIVKKQEKKAKGDSRLRISTVLVPRVLICVYYITYLLLFINFS